jgi:hypothetical protein
MLPAGLEGAIQALVRSISSRDWDGALAQCVKSRLTQSDLEKAIQDYGRTVIIPPSEGSFAFDAVPLEGVGVPTWSVRAPLLTQEEGRSDLTLEVTIAFGSDGPPLLELDDLRVL